MLLFASRCLWHLYCFLIILSTFLSQHLCLLLPLPEIQFPRYMQGPLPQVPAQMSPYQKGLLITLCETAPLFPTSTVLSPESGQAGSCCGSKQPHNTGGLKDKICFSRKELLCCQSPGRSALHGVHSRIRLIAWLPS